MVSSVVTYLGQKNLNSITTLQQSPLGVRLAKVIVSYVGYLRDILWPEVFDGIVSVSSLRSLFSRSC